MSKSPVAYTRVSLLPCGGVNPRTGLTVGGRHRWPSGWGQGSCKYCHRTLEELTRKWNVHEDGSETLAED